MRIALLFMLGPCALASTTAAQSTAFTYQGRLQTGGQPAAGPHDMRFRLFDAPSGGVQAGTTQCADNVPVAGGLFTVAIDFGPQFATPSPRFLEIDVRTDTGQNCSNTAGFVALLPRQLLTAAPLANHARSAFTLAASDGTPASAVSVDSTGNVGIGTLAPVEPLHIAFPAPVLNLQDSDSGTSGQVGLVSFRNSTGFESAWLGFGSAGNAHAHFMNNRPGGNLALGAGGLERLTVRPTGNVGIGTTLPVARLHVSSESLVAGHFQTSTPFPFMTTAIYAQANGPGTLGKLAPAIWGSSDSTNAIVGTINDNNLSAISGSTTGASGSGVAGHAPGASFGVFAFGSLGASGAKSFRIDHPLDPSRKFLRHYCSEGPEPLNIYSGTATTNANGVAAVLLPEYFESINRDPRVQLTVEDASNEFVMVKVAGPVEDGRMVIRTSKPGIRVHWEVKAVRNDRWVRAHGAPVEEDKPEAERGLYQHPELYGLGAEYEMSNGLLRTDRRRPMR